ncbi:zinc finger protein 91-like isoform X2 [Bradysia coprophila]|nr:zinc finger protein 91-like isoform X2 [Bradysia coprophila]
MATTTTIPTNPIKKLSSKAAEIYRLEGGRICYLCFHCGFDSDSIKDILAHIEIHFTSQNPIGTDEQPEFAVIKCEPFDEDSHPDPNQLEQVFVDCDIKQISDKEKCEEMDDTYSAAEIPQPLLGPDDNSTYLECLFEWKCLHCHSFFKKCSKLLQHLTQKHRNDPVMSVIDGTNTIKAHYTLKCTLCSSEFYDSHSSEQHLKDFHPASPPVKCFSCCEKFHSAESLKHHTATVHGSTDKDDAGTVQSPESIQPKETSTQKMSKHSICTFCDKTITGRIEFMQHTFGHFSLKIFSCTECPTNFQRLNTFNAHMKKVHNRRVGPKLSCRFCNVDHNSLLGFMTHSFMMHLDDGDRNNSIMDTAFDYQCRFCFQQFNKWTDVRAHLKDDHVHDELPNELPSAVIATGRTFTERARSRTNRSESLYNCLSCTTTLCGSYEARKHEITEHKATLKPVEYAQVPLSNPIHYRIIFMPEKKNFKCFDCDKSFETEIYLMRHRLTHFNVQPYSCTICAQTFSSSGNATRHITKEHNAFTETEYQCRSLTCRFCKIDFNDDNSFIAHSFKEHLYENFKLDENLDEMCKYQCLYCNEIIMGHLCMDQHLQTHAGEAALPETNSQDMGPEESSINELRHNSEFKYLCLQCPLKFRLPFVAKTHAKFAHKAEDHEKKSADDGTKAASVTERSTHCLTCNTTFMTWRSMINHSAKVHPETIVRNPKYKKKVGQQAISITTKKKKRRSPEGNNCNICHMTFLSNRSMINHRTKRHPETVVSSENHPLHTCSICDRTFRERSNFNKHIQTHTKIPSYSCNICDKSYRLKNSLDTHLLTHTNEKNFVCEECGKSFYTTSKLNFHKQVHENLTLQCDKCDKVFYTRNNFSKHQKTHTDNVRKKCKICSNTFKSAVSLRVHMALHDDKKKYSCRYCDMTFAQSSGRRGHERSRHGFV